MDRNAALALAVALVADPRVAVCPAGLLVTVAGDEFDRPGNTLRTLVGYSLDALLAAGVERHLIGFGDVSAVESGRYGRRVEVYSRTVLVGGA